MMQSRRDGKKVVVEVRMKREETGEEWVDKGEEKGYMIILNGRRRDRKVDEMDRKGIGKEEGNRWRRENRKERRRGV